jgi:ribosomal protein L37AE/L43A
MANDREAEKSRLKTEYEAQISRLKTEYEAQISRLKTEHEAEMSRLQAQVEQLKREKGISNARAGLTFNQRTQTYVDASGLHHCPSCLAEDVRRLLVEMEFGWHCNACDAFYSNPDKPSPESE